MLVVTLALGCWRRTEESGVVPAHAGELSAAAGASSPTPSLSGLPRVVPPPSIGPAPSAAPLATATHPAAGWLARCAGHVTEAQRRAGAAEPEILRASVKAEVRDAAAGRAEVVSLYMFPPTFRTGGLGLSIERSGRAGRTPGGWQRFAESLHGGYHAMSMRDATAGHATLSFDGWPPGQVEQVAPLFEAAADACLDDGAP